MILKDKEAGIFTMRLNVGEYFGQKPEEFFIVLREPTMDEVLKVQGIKDEAQRNDHLFKKMDGFIIEHNFEKEDPKDPKNIILMSNKEVWEAIMIRSDAASLVSEKWVEECPLFKRSRTKLGTSQPTV